MNLDLTKQVDPYIAYRARVESERTAKRLKAEEITMEEVKWKVDEISCRFHTISEERKVKHPCYHIHYSDAKSVANKVRKEGKISKKQWGKLVKLSFTLYEIQHDRGVHYCGLSRYKR